MKSIERPVWDKPKENDTLYQLLNRQVFPWEGTSETLAELIKRSSIENAKAKLAEINLRTASTPNDILEIVRPRAASWKLEALLEKFALEQNETLGRFISSLQSSKEPNDEGEKWIRENLLSEAKRAERRKSTRETELKSLREEALQEKILTMKRTPDEKYGDLFNRTVSTKLDELIRDGVFFPESNQLAYAEKLIRTSLEQQIDLEKYLTDKFKSQSINKLKQLKKRLSSKTNDPEVLSSLTAILFEISQRKTDETRNERKLEKIISETLCGGKIKIATILCVNSKFDDQGYTMVTDLFSYKTNPKLLPIPEIITELSTLQNFFTFYGIPADLTIYVADTDYEEIGQYGPVTQRNLDNLKTYIENLQQFVPTVNPNANVVPISAITGGNGLYQEVRERILKKITSFKDQDFSDRWAKKFVDAFEKVAESQFKRMLYPKNKIRAISLEITRRFWASNAAQGAVLSTLDENTIFMSTERRERDENYFIDSEASKNFPPILYILKSTAPKTKTPTADGMLE